MNSPQEDIALIRKYHNGELSPVEKNKLEARALDDPFLQDAIDGFEKSGVKDEEISALTQKLEERVTSTKVIAPVWGVRQWGIAASVLICIAMAGIYFNQTPTNKTIALNDLQQKEDIPQIEKSKIVPNVHTDPDHLNTPDNSSLEMAFNDGDIVKEKAKTYTPEPDILVEPLASGKVMDDSANLLGEVKAVEYAALSKKELASAPSLKQENLMAARMLRVPKETLHINLRGKIVDETDSTALPGVSIKNLDTGVSKQADVNGEFSIEAASGNSLGFNYIGYETKQIVVKSADLLVVKLKPSQASLSETVIVGYGAAKKESNGAVGPKIGWKRFKQYVDDEAQKLNIGRGKVEVQFVINTNGELSDFKIINSFSAQAGVAAINIIKNYGAGWFGSAEKIPHQTNITLKFK